MVTMLSMWIKSVALLSKRMFACAGNSSSLSQNINLTGIQEKACSRKPESVSRFPRRAFTASSNRSSFPEKVAASGVRMPFWNAAVKGEPSFNARKGTHSPVSRADGEAYRNRV